MGVFKTEWIILRTGKMSEKDSFYKIIFRDYGILTVKKRKKSREKPIDVGYHINCEIITHKDKNIHTIGNIKILNFFSWEKRRYSEIESFLKILSLISQELPEWSPHYEIYNILSTLITKWMDITSHKLLLTHLKIIQYFWVLPTFHDDVLVEKTLQYIHTHHYKNILALGEIPEKLEKKLKKFL